MSIGTLASAAEDQALPALQQALDMGVMLPFLTQAAGVQPGSGERLTCSAQVLKHKVGRRCAIKYTLDYRSSQRAAGTTAIVGKLYREASSAARIFRWMGTLREGRFSGGEPFSTPAPLSLVTDLRLVLQEHIDGADLRHLLAAKREHRAVYLAGKWIAALHATPPPPGARVKPLGREVAKIDGWCSEIAPHLTAAQAAGLRQAQDGLHWLASRLPPKKPALIHHDFYPANVVWDGDRLWVLDLDELSVGDPALDVAHFLAHFENLSYRTEGKINSFQKQGAIFLESYLEAIDIDLRLRLPFYKAYTLLKLAAKEGRRQRGDWRRFLTVLTSLGCEEAANGLREAC